MAAYARRAFAGGAVTTTLAGGMGAADTTFTITSATGWPGASPAGNFYVTIDRGLTSEEKILCASNSGTTVTVAASGRGVDGTSATTHAATATVSITVTAVDADEANQAVVQLLGQSGVAAGDLNYVSGTSPTVYSRLAIGANTRILTSTGTAPQWSTQAAAIGLTTKGDLATFGSALARLPVGADGTILTARSSATNGIDWELGSSTAYTPTVGPVTLGNGSVTGGYAQVGPLVFFKAALTAGTTTTTTGGITFSLPVAAAVQSTNVTGFYLTSGGVFYPAMGVCSIGTTCTFYTGWTGAASADSISAANPLSGSLGSGAGASVSGFYFAA